MASDAERSSDSRASAIFRSRSTRFLFALGGQQRQLARQQVVAGVAVGHFHDLAAAAQVFDVVAEDDFHASPSYSVTYGSSAICRARMMAVRSLRWCSAQVPEMRRGSTLPRSGTKPDSIRTSL